jgi:hypothetical protein
MAPGPKAFFPEQVTLLNTFVSVAMGLIITVIVIIINARLFLGYLISFRRPCAKIDQPTALGTEGSMRIVFPLDVGLTCWTFDSHRHRRAAQVSSVLGAKSSSTSSFFSIRP